jgi:hypothetical protein
MKPSGGTQADVDEPGYGLLQTKRMFLRFGRLHIISKEKCDQKAAAAASIWNLAPAAGVRRYQARDRF